MLNNVILNQELSECGIGVYAALRSIFVQSRDRYYTSINSIYFHLTNTDEFCDSRRIQENIKQGIDELCNIGVINLVNVKSADYIIDLKELNIGKYKTTGKSFTTIDSSELYKIMNYRSIDKFKLLRYFIYLIYSCVKRKDGDVGFEAVSEMVRFLNFDEKTIRKYNDILQRMNLIYIYKMKDSYIDSNGNFTSIPNTYGRYKDKAKIIERGQEHEIKYGNQYQAQFKKEHSNKVKSASQKYNVFCNGKEYSLKELENIYIVLKEFNSRQTDNTKLKDLTIFSEYDFYNSE